MKATNGIAEDVLATTFKSLMARRDRIVHMQSAQVAFDEAKQMSRPPTPSSDPVVDAKVVLEGMETFFLHVGRILVDHDPEMWSLMMPM